METKAIRVNPDFRHDVSAFDYLINIVKPEIKSPNDKSVRDITEIMKEITDTFVDAINQNQLAVDGVAKEKTIRVSVFGNELLDAVTKLLDKMKLDYVVRNYGPDRMPKTESLQYPGAEEIKDYNNGYNKGMKDAEMGLPVDESLVLNPENPAYVNGYMDGYNEVKSYTEDAGITTTADMSIEPLIIDDDDEENTKSKDKKESVMSIVKIQLDDATSLDAAKAVVTKVAQQYTYTVNDENAEANSFEVIVPEEDVANAMELFTHQLPDAKISTKKAESVADRLLSHKTVVEAVLESV